MKIFFGKIREKVDIGKKMWYSVGYDEQVFGFAGTRGRFGFAFFARAGGGGRFCGVGGENGGKTMILAWFFIAIAYAVARPLVWEAEGMLGYFFIPYIWALIASSVLAAAANWRYGKLSGVEQVRQGKVVLYGLLFVLIYADIVSKFPGPSARMPSPAVYAFSFAFFSGLIFALSWSAIRGCENWKNWMAVEVPWIRKTIVFVSTAMGVFFLFATAHLFATVELRLQLRLFLIFGTFAYFMPLATSIFYSKKGF